MTRMSEILDRRASEGLVGRRRELEILRSSLDPEGPVVTHIHGIGGIGKSTLLASFAAWARRQGVTVLSLDCRGIEPTARGFLAEIGQALGTTVTSADEVAAALESAGPTVLLTLDTYEVFGLLDTWLRQVFLPAQSDGFRLVLAGRLPPASAWTSLPEWQGLVVSLPLDSLSEDESLELLGRLGVEGEKAARIQRLAVGHPLALKLGGVARGAPTEGGEAGGRDPVFELSRMFLSDVRDPALRTALEAASVVRRLNQPLLAAMLPDEDPRQLWDALAALPVIEARRDGLSMHDAVHEAIAGALEIADPGRYRQYRRAAWQTLRREAQEAGPEELWRTTADMLYLAENPVAREAFFPSGTQRLVVEPARDEDHETILDITRQHEGPEAVRLVELWWRRLPESFHVVRDRSHDFVGYYCMFDPQSVDPADLVRDPITAAWAEHLKREPLSRTLSTLFIRRWLGREDGEAPSPIQAACWLDIKRTYMEMRPALRRVYLTVVDLPTYAPVAIELGFRPIDRAARRLDEVTYHTAMLDFGPASVDGWLSRIVAAELGVQEGGILDVRARQLVLEELRVDLTPLEYELLSYLCQNEGKACSRAELLQKVWGHEHLGASNVVDAVVRTLRKKLGDQADRVETVRGVGYRFQAA